MECDTDGLSAGVEPSARMEVEGDLDFDAGTDPACDPEDVPVLATNDEPSREAELVKEAEEEHYPYKEGDKQYLISLRWYKVWTDYTGLVKEPGAGAVVRELQAGEERLPRPGEIDNSDILARPDDGEHIVLRPALLEGRDFVLRCEATWRLLHGWYGGGPELVADTYQSSLGEQRPTVDIYPLTLTVIRSSDNMQRTIRISKMATVRALKDVALAALSLKDEDTHMWDYFSKSFYGLLETKMSQNLELARIMDNQDVLLVEKVNGEWPSTPSAPLSTPSQPLLLGSSYYNPEDVVYQSAAARKGLAGLGNLGNTCFMNSSLQCLAHTVPIMEVFLSGNYKTELNRQNPLGCGGELAEAFGSLMEKLWQGGVSSVAPKAFKAKLGRFAPQFQGYQQQDSQELLAFLLDGLHEDLNRIINKPYVEEAESDGRPDAELALQAWSNYKARNDSYIVDNCQGIYKSTVDCPRCHHSSVKFEVFMYLSLPLPSSRTRAINVTVVAVDGSQLPVMYTVDVPKAGTVRDLYRAIGAKLGMPDGLQLEQILLLVEVAHSRVNVRLEDLRMSLAGVHNYVVAYLYPNPEVGPLSGLKEVHVFHRKRPNSWHFSTPQLFAAPLVFFMDTDKVEAAEASCAGDSSQIKSVLKREYVLMPENELTSAVETALRPFKRVKRAKMSPEVEIELKATCATRLNGSDSDADATSMIMVDNEAAGPSNWDEPTGDGPLEPGTPTGVSVVGNQSAVFSPHETPQVSPQTSPMISPSTSPRGLPKIKPFNMWASMSREDPVLGCSDKEDAPAAEAAAAWENEPFVLKRADEWGSCALSSWPALSSGTIYFAIDWQLSNDAYETDQLERPEMDESARAAHEPQDKGPVRHTLQQCLNVYLQPERLEEDDKWYCRKCEDHVQADKKLDLWSLPEVLVVHLKRFSYSRSMRDKLTAEVDFPLRGLDMTPYLLPHQDVPAIYDLYAVSNHMGGMGGGHYTACCKMPGEDQWYCFDDGHVRPIPEDDVCSAFAYVLFYRRRDAMQKDAAVLEELLKVPDPAEDESMEDAVGPELSPTDESPTDGAGPESLYEPEAEAGPGPSPEDVLLPPASPGWDACPDGVLDSVPALLSDSEPAAPSDVDEAADEGTVPTQAEEGGQSTDLPMMITHLVSPDGMALEDAPSDAGADADDDSDMGGSYVPVKSGSTSSEKSSSGTATGNDDFVMVDH